MIARVGWAEYAKRLKQQKRQKRPTSFKFRRGKPA
jgi:hypothetical protein